MKIGSFVYQLMQILHIYAISLLKKTNGIKKRRDIITDSFSLYGCYYTSVYKFSSKIFYENIRGSCEIMLMLGIGKLLGNFLFNLKYLL